MDTKKFMAYWGKWRMSIKVLPITILALTLTMTIGAVIILWAQRTKDNLIVSTNEVQLGRTASILFEMRHNEYRRLVYDYSFWDELYAYTSNPSPEWARNNLESYIRTYKANATYVFNKNYKILYFEADALFSTLPKEIIDSQIISQIYKQKVFQTFIKHNNVIVEVSGATIHTTADEDRVGPPNGILIACKIWDQTVLDIFKKAIIGEVEIYTKAIRIEFIPIANPI